MFVVFVSFQQVMILVIPSSGQDLRVVAAGAVVLAAVWALLTRSWDLQNDLGKGPCLTSAYDHVTVRAPT